MISRIIKAEVRVISRSPRLKRPSKIVIQLKFIVTCVTKKKNVTFCFFLQETSPSQENEPEMLGARRTFKVKRKRMKNKFKFKKASLNATDLMKGEDGE